MRRFAGSKLVLFAAALLAAMGWGGTGWAQVLPVGTSVECDPSGLGNYRFGTVLAALDDGANYKIKVHDYSEYGDPAICTAASLRAVPPDSFLKGPPKAYGLFHAGDRVECSDAAGAPMRPGSVVGIVDPHGVYNVLFDDTDPYGKALTCAVATMKPFSGAPDGLRGFTKEPKPAPTS